MQFWHIIYGIAVLNNVQLYSHAEPLGCPTQVVAAVGDTCTSVASAHGISVAQFIQDNPDLKNCMLTVGKTYCIGSSDNSAASVQPSLIPSTDATCGEGFTCYGSQFGDCCSKNGYCGDTSAYCGNGCQPLYGVCQPNGPDQGGSGSGSSAGPERAASGSRADSVRTLTVTSTKFGDPKTITVTQQTTQAATITVLAFTRESPQTLTVTSTSYKSAEPVTVVSTSYQPARTVTVTSTSTIRNPQQSVITQCTTGSIVSPEKITITETSMSVPEPMTITITIMTISFSYVVDTVTATSAPETITIMTISYSYLTDTIMTISYSYVTDTVTASDAFTTTNTITVTNTIVSTAPAETITVSFISTLTTTQTRAFLTKTVTATPSMATYPGTTITVVSMGTAAPTPSHKGTAKTCNMYYRAKASDSCQALAWSHGITVDQLRNWNPNVDCSKLETLAGYYICVGVQNPYSTPNAIPSEPDTAALGNSICFDGNQIPDAGPDLGVARPDCPLPVENRLHTVPGTNLTFLRSCDTEISGDDIGWFPVLTMQDCLALCARLNLFPSSVQGKCVAATWVYGDGPQGSGVSFCFPKSNVQGSSRREGTESAELWTDSG